MILSRLFSKGEPAAPRGRRAYAVGDIHGRLDLLDKLLDSIAVDDRSRRAAKTSIIFLGDLIDRGPHSAQVVERLRLFEPDFATPAYLMGNHEEVMLDVLDGDSSRLRDWLKFGGAECLESYGLDPHALRGMDGEAAVAQVRQAIPPSHVEFIRSFADTVSFGDYLFVHAGIRPGVPLGRQEAEDLRWIRQPFLDDDSDHGLFVIHGHTINDDVDTRVNRIGIDTGAYASGKLTAIGLEERDRWFLQTGVCEGEEEGCVAVVSHAH